MNARPAVVRFDRYGVTRVLARGGMADIFRARALDDPESPWVALKLMRTEADQRDVREALFAREIEIASRLDHPNVVKLVDHGRHEGRPFLVMEYIEGRDAETFVARATDRPLPPDLVIALGAQAARGLGHAHRRTAPGRGPLGIVHRDVSPGNLRVDWSGQLKLLDFGVARARVPDQDLTQTGTLRGKYAYMSPEQTAGGTLDARSDVFSLGVVLFELVTGRRAFLRDGPVETMESVRADRLPRPTQLRSGLSDAVDGLLARCLSKDPALRFRDGIAMADALDAHLDASGFDGRTAWREYLAVTYRTERAAERRLLEEEEAAFRAYRSAPEAPRSVPTSGLVGRSLLRSDPEAAPLPARRPLAYAGAALAAVGLAASAWWWSSRPPGVRRIDPVRIEAPARAGEAER